MPSSRNNLQMKTIIGILVGQWKQIQKQYRKRDQSQFNICIHFLVDCCICWLDFTSRLNDGDFCDSNHIGRSYHEAAVELTARQSNWILFGLDDWIPHVRNIGLINQAGLIDSVNLIGLFKIIKIIVYRISCVGLVSHISHKWSRWTW